MNRTCKFCGQEIEFHSGAVGWVETRSGDDGGYYDICPENGGSEGDGHQPGANRETEE